MRWNNVARRFGYLLWFFGITGDLGAEIVLPKGSVQIHTLFDASAIVATGLVKRVSVVSKQTTVASSTDRRTADTTLEFERATVELLRVYKGQPDQTVQVDFISARPVTTSVFGPDLKEGEIALLFLESSENGQYRFAGNDNGKFDLGACAVTRRGESSLPQMGDDLLPCLADDDQHPEQALDVLIALQEISPETEGRLKSLTLADDPHVAAEAFAALLNTRKNIYYAGLGDFLDRRGKSIEPQDQSLLFGKIQDPPQDGDPEAFDRLSKSSLPSIRLASMYALRRISSPKSVATLIDHLADADSNIQFLAIVALNNIVHNGDTFEPTNYDFDRQPQVYVERWRHWWETDGRKQYAPN